MAMRYNDGFADYNQVHAQAQAVADVRDDAAEADRRRRVKEANLAAFDAAREQGRGGRSMITASAFDGDGMRRDYMGGRLVGEMPLDSQGAIAAEFMDLANRSTAARRHNAQIESDSLNSAMMAARRNGGVLPQNAVDMLSRKLGMDGKTSAVFRAGYLDNGDFDIDIVTRGQDGGLQRRTKKISPLEQYNLMLGAPGVWGAEGQAVADGLYQRLRGTRGKSELAAPSTYGQNLSAYQDGQRTKQEMQAGIELLKLAKEFSGNGKGGEEGLLKAVVGNKAFAGILARGDRIYEDAAGNEVDNPYEEDGKTLRKDVKPKLGEDNKPMYREDPELAFQRIHKAWERVSAGGGAGGGGIGDAIMQVALSRLSPRQPSPEEAEIAQRQRQNALDDQRRADLMRGREQQLIHYIDENGTHKVGNGYVVDGKVYDGDGNEMSGVRLADRNGNPLQTAQAQPSTQRETADSGLAGTSAADVVSGGSGGGGDPKMAEILKDGPTVEAAARLNGSDGVDAQGGGRNPAPQVAGTAEQSVSRQSDDEAKRARVAELEREIARRKAAQKDFDREAAGAAHRLYEETGGKAGVPEITPSERVRENYEKAFEGIQQQAEEAARRSVEADRRTTGKDTLKYEDAYRDILTRLLRKRVSEMSADQLEQLERMEPGNLNSQRVNMRQSLYDMYGVDIYDSPGFMGALSGNGGIGNRPFYEDLTDNNGEVHKGSWRRGGEATADLGSSRSVGVGKRKNENSKR